MNDMDLDDFGMTPPIKESMPDRKEQGCRLKIDRKGHRIAGQNAGCFEMMLQTEGHSRLIRCKVRTLIAPLTDSPAV